MICKEAITTRHLCEGTEDNHDILSQSSWLSGRDMNLTGVFMVLPSFYSGILGWCL